MDTTITFAFSVAGSEEVTVDAVIFEYNSKDERIGNHSFKDCKKGTTEIFVANPATEKAKVLLNFNSGSLTKGMWVQQIYYLNAGQNNLIELSGSTITGSKEP